MSSTNRRKATTSRAAVKQKGQSQQTRAGRSRAGGGGGPAPVRVPGRGGGGFRGTPATARSGRGAAASQGPALVVAQVPVLARVTGGVAVASAVLQLVAPAFPLVTETGADGVGAAANLFDFVPVLVVAAVLGGAGLLCLLGRLPRLGLGVVAGAGACSIGLLVQALFLYDSADRSSRDLPVPEALSRSFEFAPAMGLRLVVAAHVLAVVALVLAGRAWPLTWMEDDGSFDALRPAFTGVSFLVGFFAVAGGCLAPSDAEVTGIGTPAILQRVGLSGAGGAAFAAALVICAVVASTLRPRLAAVGMYAGLAAVLGAHRLANALLVARSDLLTVSLGGVLLLVGAAGFAGLAVAAWKLSGEPHRP